MNVYTILGIKPEWKIYFDAGLHLEAERLDNEFKLNEYMEYLKETDLNAHNFILWHIEKTTPVFGKWNYEQ